MHSKNVQDKTEKDKRLVLFSRFNIYQGMIMRILECYETKITVKEITLWNHMRAGISKSCMYYMQLIIQLRKLKH